MITLPDFIRGIEDNAKRVHTYKQPGDGSNGECDCIGLIIGGKRLAGGKWTGSHGSNYSARFQMDSLERIYEQGDLFIGEIVYKKLEPGESGYNLPAKYKEGGAAYTGDLRDYYHVGVVTDISPVEITHCSSPGGPIFRDTKLGKWAFGGRLKDVDYGEVAKAAPTEEMTGMVTVSGGNANEPVNMRKSRNTSSARLDQIPQGTSVKLLDADTEWAHIVYKGKTGYVLTKFVHSGEDQGEAAVKNAVGGETIAVNRAELERAYDIIGDLLGLRG